MKKHFLSPLTCIAILLFVYTFVTYFLIGIRTVPVEGDSLAYHIPIAKMILAGNILHPQGNTFLLYYPSTIETLLSVFMFLKIPLNLFNVFGILALFISSYYLGIEYGLKQDFSFIFSTSVCLTEGIVRWLSAQIIDIWLAVFYLLLFIAITKIKNSSFSYFIVGLLAGILVGSKLPAFWLFVILCVCFSQSIRKTLSIKNFLSFIIPFSVIGLFWYIRNYILIGNPVYPISFFVFHGAPHWNILKIQIGETILFDTKKFLNAIFSEYTVWSFSILFVPLALIYQYRMGKLHFDKLTKLAIIGLLNFIYFLFFPSSHEYNIIVSGFRYSYTSFILLILYSFTIFQMAKAEKIISLISLVCIIVLLLPIYHPKILLVLIPLLLFFYFILNYLLIRGKSLNHIIFHKDN